MLLAQTHQQLMACLDSHYFRNISMRPVNISGYICAVIVAERSSIAFVAPQKNEKKVFVDSNKKRKLSE